LPLLSRGDADGRRQVAVKEHRCNGCRARHLDRPALQAAGRHRKVDTVGGGSDVDETVSQRQPAADEKMLDAGREVGVDAEIVQPEWTRARDRAVERHDITSGA